MKRRIFLIATILTVALGMFLVNSENAFTEEAALVKIWAQKESTPDKLGLRVDPVSLTIKKGTLVVWMNGVVGKEIQVVFEEGKTCRDVTANPNQKEPGFFLDVRDCYVTSFLPYTNTSTLQFPEVGSFNYKVMTEDGKMSAKGIIIVKEEIKHRD